MWAPDELDVVRDALALVQACHGGDLDGARVILDNCNTRLAAMFLARVCTDLLEDLTDDPVAAIGWLRETRLGGA